MFCNEQARVYMQLQLQGLPRELACAENGRGTQDAEKGGSSDVNAPGTKQQCISRVTRSKYPLLPRPLINC